MIIGGHGIASSAVSSDGFRSSTGSTKIRIHPGLDIRELLSGFRTKESIGFHRALAVSARHMLRRVTRASPHDDEHPALLPKEIAPEHRGAPVVRREVQVVGVTVGDGVAAEVDGIGGARSGP